MSLDKIWQDARGMAAIGNKTNERASVSFSVQKVLGLKSAATITVYQDVAEQEVRKVLKNAGKNYDS